MASSSLLESLDRLSATAEAREAYGTAAALRRALAQLPDESMGARRREQYAHAYRAALSESALCFLHLSKSGGTALCELAKLNGCTRAAAGQSTFSGNCVDRRRFDGPWWMPEDVLAKVQPPGLQQFAQRSFRVMPPWYRRAHSCHGRHRRSATAAVTSASAPTFFAVEGAARAAPLPRRAGAADARDPLRRLASFGRELTR